VPTQRAENGDLSPNLSECALYKLRTIRGVFAPATVCSSKCCRDATNERRGNRRGRNGNRSRPRRECRTRIRSNNIGALLLFRRNKRRAGISCFSPRTRLRKWIVSGARCKSTAIARFDPPSAILAHLLRLIRVVSHLSAKDWSQAERNFLFSMPNNFYHGEATGDNSARQEDRDD
jgi:hypothetical protein